MKKIERITEAEIRVALKNDLLKAIQNYNRASTNGWASAEYWKSRVGSISQDLERLGVKSHNTILAKINP